MGGDDHLGHLVGRRRPSASTRGRRRRSTGTPRSAPGCGRPRPRRCGIRGRARRWPRGRPGRTGRPAPPPRAPARPASGRCPRACAARRPAGRLRPPVRPGPPGRPGRRSAARRAGPRRGRWWTGRTCPRPAATPASRRAPAPGSPRARCSARPAAARPTRARSGSSRRPARRPRRAAHAAARSSRRPGSAGQGPAVRCACRTRSWWTQSCWTRSRWSWRAPSGVDAVILQPIARSSYNCPRGCVRSYERAIGGRAAGHPLCADLALVLLAAVGRRRHG